MKKLKELYIRNSILQFIVSYVFVLLIPLFICGMGAQLSFRVVEEDVKSSKLSMLNHSKSVMDSNIRQIHTLALQVSRNPFVQKAAQSEEALGADFYINAKEAIKQTDNIVKFKTANLFDKIAVYYENSNYYMVDGTLYKGDFYYHNLLKNEIYTLPKWKKLYGGQTGKNFYRTDKGIIQWIQPIMGEDGEALEGSIICNLDMDYLDSLFVDTPGTQLIIMEENKNILYSTMKGIETKEFASFDFDKNQGVMEWEGNLLIYTTSPLDNWKYVTLIEKREAMQRLNILKRNEYLLIFAAIGLGMGLACYTSVKQGKPMNEIFNIYIPDKKVQRSFKNLGEVVSEIIHNNHQLMEELEKEKSLLQYAFLNKLIRGEFSNKKELTLLANKVDYKVEASSYQVMALRFFGNNDFNEMDSQTLEEVQIIFHYLQSKLKTYITQEFWIYEIDYLTRLLILPSTSKEQDCDDIISFVKKELTSAYKVTPLWGISNACFDIMELWRACEEAKEALSYTTDARNFVFYKEIAKEKTGFYYPELFEERLMGSVKAGDNVHIENLLNLSQKENFELRRLNRNKFLKLNNSFVNTLMKLDYTPKAVSEIEELNYFVINYGERDIQIYYELLAKLFYATSQRMQQYKLGKRARLTDNIKEYVNETYTDAGLGLSKVGTQFNISEGYVSILFKEQIGINFADYVEKLRIDKACQLLVEEKLSVEQVGEAIGYNSIQSFRRAFKKVKGVSPSKFRMQTNQKAFTY